MKGFLRLYREYVLPTVLVGSLTVGAGMFALPYVFSKSGFLTGGIYLILFTLIFIKINNDYAFIVSKHSAKYRFASYAHEYLGKWGFGLSLIAVVLGLLLTLTIYVILSGSFWHLISPVGEGIANYIFWGLSSFTVVASLKKLLNLDAFISAAMLGIILFMFFVGMKNGLPTINPDYSLEGLLLPYGVVLFALYGRAAIAPLEDYYKAHKLDWTKSRLPIALGTAIPAILFMLFALGVVGLSPTGVTEDAVSGISNGTILYLPIVGILGLLTIWTSYIVIGTEIKDIIANDLGAHNFFGLLVVCLVPILFYVFGVGSFITLVGIAGAIFLAIECALVILMRGRLKGGLSLLDILIVLLLIAGAVHAVWIQF